MKSLILIIFILNINVIFGQTKKIHIIEVSSIKYYYVYKAVEYEKNPSDTLILLGNKANNDEHKIIALQKEKKYEIETRLKSAIKISKNKFMFCKPTCNILNNIIISNKKNLPVLIIDFKELSN